MKLGIIGATGWLGAALGTRLLQAGWPPKDLLLLNRQAPRTAYALWPAVRWLADAGAMYANAEALVLSVRPADFPIPGHGPGPRLVISFMTAWSLDRLAAIHPGAAIVRAMPNSGAPLGQSFTPWVAGPGLSDADRGLVRRILAAMGDEAEVLSEAQLDYLSALSGSGAAYPALLAQAMLDHAAGQGVAPEVARRAVASVLASGGALAADVAGVADVLRVYHGYRGITAAGLGAAEGAGLPGAVAAALDAACAHARKMTRDGV